MALQAFAGLRYEEICPDLPTDPDALEWRDILWDKNLIHVRPEVAKTDGRYVPLLPVLKEWLLPLKKKTGRVYLRRRMDKKFARAAKAAGITWKHNGLRHGYGSFRMSIEQNLHQVSEEMGNSPAVVKKDYRVPYPEDVAVAWFKVTRPGVAKWKRENPMVPLK
jgi:integrase